MKAEQILEFWFKQAGPSKWYHGGDAFDAEIRNRFENFSIEAAAHLKKHNSHDWGRPARSALALIIALDQFTRNMYRDTKGAFAFDALALACAQRAIDKGHDLKTDQNRRAFFYMPFMHAEDMAMQDECVRLIDMRLESENSLFHAKEHRKLIVRFGRFPHRNAILGRKSSKDETRFLHDGAMRREKAETKKDTDNESRR